MDEGKVHDLRNGTSNGGEKRCLCCLPRELLLIVLGNLSVIDYVCFRVVCKCWQSAFSRCSAFISPKQLPRQVPCFMLLRSEECPEELHLSQNKQHFLQTTGNFGDLPSKCIYNTNIPELCETRFLLSRHGWLLLFSSKNGCTFLFFLNPFSRARIDIPLIDVDKLWHPVFDVSAPPTSPDCMVFVISCRDFGIEIRTCCRRESTWKSNSFEYHGVSGHVVNTVFVCGIWYCLHERGSFSAFDVVNNCWRFLGRPEGMCIQNSQVKLLSYVIKRGAQVYMCVHGSVFHEILLEEPLKATRNFIDGDWHVKVEFPLRTSPRRAFQNLQNEMEIFDTFNGQAWCADLTVKYDIITFRWHHFRSYLNDRFPMDKWNCPRNNKECSTIVAWVEPVWVHPSADLGWMF